MDYCWHKPIMSQAVIHCFKTSANLTVINYINFLRLDVCLLTYCQCRMSNKYWKFVWAVNLQLRLLKIKLYFNLVIGHFSLFWISRMKIYIYTKKNPTITRILYILKSFLCNLTLVQRKTETTLTSIYGNQYSTSMRNRKDF